MKNSLKFTIFLAIAFIVLVTSCVCKCSAKFYQVTYKDGKVEYYTSGDINLQGYSGTEGYLQLTIRDTAGTKISERTIPAELIQSLDEIEGDMPTTNAPIVPVVPADTKKDTSLPTVPTNIKIK